MASTVDVCSISFDSEVLTKLDGIIKESAGDARISRSRVINEVLKYVMNTPTYIPSVVQNLKAQQS